MVVYWQNWDPMGVRVSTNGRKIVLDGDLVQISKGGIVFDPSDTSMCVGVSPEFVEKMRKFEEYIRSYGDSMSKLWYNHTDYKSPLTDSYMRVSYNSQTDMFDESDNPINIVAKDTYVRMILRFKMTVTKTTYKLVPELVQLKIVPQPKPDEWLGD